MMQLIAKTHEERITELERLVAELRRTVGGTNDVTSQLSNLRGAQNYPNDLSNLQAAQQQADRERNR